MTTIDVIQVVVIAIRILVVEQVVAEAVGLPAVPLGGGQDVVPIAMGLEGGRLLRILVDLMSLVQGLRETVLLAAIPARALDNAPGIHVLTGIPLIVGVGFGMAMLDQPAVGMIPVLIQLVVAMTDLLIVVAMVTIVLVVGMTKVLEAQDHVQIPVQPTQELPEVVAIRLP